MGRIEHDQIIQETTSTQFQWAFDAVKNNVTDEYVSDFIEECSNDSSMTLSSSETIDDATSSPSSSSSLFHDGPLYELSGLMDHLPIKRGLSKYYQGKSESFGSLANFKNIEDLAKKGSQRSRREELRGGLGQAGRCSGGSLGRARKCFGGDLGRVRREYTRSCAQGGLRGGSRSRSRKSVAGKEVAPVAKDFAQGQEEGDRVELRRNRRKGIESAGSAMFF